MVCVTQPRRANYSFNLLHFSAEHLKIIPVHEDLAQHTHVVPRLFYHSIDISLESQTTFPLHVMFRLILNENRSSAASYLTCAGNHPVASRSERNAAEIMRTCVTNIRHIRAFRRIHAIVQDCDGYPVTSVPLGSWPHGYGQSISAWILGIFRTTAIDNHGGKTTK